MPKQKQAMGLLATKIMRSLSASFILAASILGITATPVWADGGDTTEVTFASTEQVGEQTLQLHGRDLLVYLVWDAYEMALYLPDGVSGQQVLANVPKKIVIHYLVDIDAEDFGPAGEKILKQNVDEASMTRFRAELDQMDAAYQDIKEGDRYALSYQPDVGTTLAKNGQALTTIPGEDFASMYFQIWFGKDPVDEDLRDNIISGKGVR